MTNQEQAAHLLAKSKEYDEKARREMLAGVRRAYEAVAREYLSQATECDPAYVASVTAPQAMPEQPPQQPQQQQPQQQKNKLDE